MNSSNDRFKHVWEETQDNLEAVVGSAVSGWARFHAAQAHNPMWTQVCELFSCATCCGWVRRTKTGSGGSGFGHDNDSFDIFHDLYDDDGELERLLSSNDAFGDDADGLANDNDDFGEFQQASALNSHHKNHTRGRSSMSHFMSSLFPGAAALTTSGNRARSDTTRSSDTFRSRTELLGPDADDDDAQIMSDGFETSLEFRADCGGDSSAVSSTHSDQNIPGAIMSNHETEEEHTDELQNLEQQRPISPSNDTALNENIIQLANTLSSNVQVKPDKEPSRPDPENFTHLNS